MTHRSCSAELQRLLPALLSMERRQPGKVRAQRLEGKLVWLWSRA